MLKFPNIRKTNHAGLWSVTILISGRKLEGKAVGLSAIKNGNLYLCGSLSSKILAYDAHCCFCDTPINPHAHIWVTVNNSDYVYPYFLFLFCTEQEELAFANREVIIKRLYPKEMTIAGNVRVHLEEPHCLFDLCLLTIIKKAKNLDEINRLKQKLPPEVFVILKKCYIDKIDAIFWRKINK